MSVDDRLRELFADPGHDVPVGSALERVHRQAKGDDVRRRAAVGGLLAAALVLTGATGLALRDDGGSPTPAPPGPSERRDLTTPLDGEWRAGPVPMTAVRSLLREEGLGTWWPEVRAALPADPVRYRMVVDAGQVEVSIRARAGRWISFDQEWLSVTGDELLLEPVSAPGVNRYRWDLVNGRLALTFLGSSEARADELPNVAYQRTLYTVAGWTRTTADRRAAGSGPASTAG